MSWPKPLNNLSWDLGLPSHRTHVKLLTWAAPGAYMRKEEVCRSSAPSSPSSRGNYITMRLIIYKTPASVSDALKETILTLFDLNTVTGRSALRSASIILLASINHRAVELSSTSSIPVKLDSRPCPSSFSVVARCAEF